MTEQIGSVTLDYTHYPGEDFYCDGAIEDELLDIVKQNPPHKFRKIIEERAQWPVLYHLSPLRENIVSWLPIDASMKVLEVGSGCGAVTGVLADKAGSVTCIDLSKKRSLINAYRHLECDNVTIHVGNFKDIEPDLPCDFDYVLLIGVFEYAQSYMGTEHPYEDFMNILQKHVKPGGRMVIAIENKWGLKYWAGCREDHLGTYFSGLEDYPDGGVVRTFTRRGLEEILQGCGINQYSFYYPYPDYKFMNSLYSDSYLPKVGELSDNIRNFDRDRLLLFDEKKVFDSIIREGLYPLYSNSYMVVIGKEPETKYAKYSNDREDKFAICTEVRLDEQGTPYVTKRALHEEGQHHIRRMEDAYRLLSKRYEGSRLVFNRCHERKAGELHFEFLNGVTLEEIFDELIGCQDQEGFLRLFEEYYKAISCREEEEISDFDLVFGNFIMGEDCWNVIDYEWTYQERFPSKELAYRAFYCYCLASPKRKTAISEESILKILNMTEEEAAGVRSREAQFQKYVTGNHMSMPQIREKIGYATLSLQEQPAEADAGGRIQIYEDTGSGFREEESYFIPGGEKPLALKVAPDVLGLRVDPMMQPCLTAIKAVCWNGVNADYLKVTSNGVKAAGGVYVFAGSDPSLVWDLKGLDKREENEMILELEITPLTEETAGRFKKRKLF